MLNSERYKTAEERAEAFGNLCHLNSCHNCPVGNPSLRGVSICAFVWLDLEAEEKKPLPCPFCGGEVYVITDAPEEWVYCKCGYGSKMCNHGASVAAHNRVARAVADAKAKEEDK